MQIHREDASPGAASNRNYQDHHHDYYGEGDHNHHGARVARRSHRHHDRIS
jgi:hypothetical protein